MDMGLIVMLAVWLVIGLLMAVLAGSIWKDHRPYGETGDYVISIIVAILTGLADWYLVPMIFPDMGRIIVFVAAILEPPLVVLGVLWLIRKIKKADAE